MDPSQNTSRALAALQQILRQADHPPNAVHGRVWQAADNKTHNKLLTAYRAELKTAVHAGSGDLAKSLQACHTAVHMTAH